MTSRLVELCIDAHDPARLSGFWAGLLERETSDDGLTLLRREDPDLAIRFLPTQRPKTGPNQVHLHLTSSSDEQQRSTVARALELGGRHLDVGQTPEEGHIVLADPEGNELCVIEAGNRFLADTAFLGELACDGSREVGLFWSGALGWPLVWDQDEETAIQSPLGGAKIAWGGPPVRPRTGPNRMHFHLAPVGPGDEQDEVRRLTALGASPIGDVRHESGWLSLSDPDGNEFCVPAPR
jgi:hypothetical protein